MAGIATWQSLLGSSWQMSERSFYCRRALAPNPTSQFQPVFLNLTCWILSIAARCCTFKEPETADTNSCHWRIFLHKDLDAVAAVASCCRILEQAVRTGASSVSRLQCLPAQQYADPMKCFFPSRHCNISKDSIFSLN